MHNSILLLTHALFRIWYALRLIKIRKLISNYHKDAENQILIYYPGRSIFTDLPHDLILIATLIYQNKTFGIVGIQKAKKINHKRIYLNLSSKYGEKMNYVNNLIELVKLFERNGNQVFYSSYEIQFWENKTRMHQLFEELGIRCPSTQVFKLTEPIPMNNFNYPLLVKEAHSSGSRGVHKINSMDELDALLKNENFMRHNQELLIQELLQIHRDFRVILVGGEIVLHYWRINPEKMWKPTSTKHGSAVDFETFPEKWRKYIIDNFKKLNLITGAFDIAWQNDDLNTEPYFLEVSPGYDPNPKYIPANGNMTYAAYKQKLGGKNNFDKAYIETHFEIKKKCIALFNQTS